MQSGERRAQRAEETGSNTALRPVFCALRSALCALFVVSCASAPPPVAPQWQSIPPVVLHALCTRLQMDAIGTGGFLTIVPMTQPLGSPASVASAAGMPRKPLTPEQVSAAIEAANRSIPVSTEATRCGFTPIGSRRRADDMIVELSAPLLHPGSSGAGLFARVSLGEQEEWYWIALGSRGEQWGVASVNAISN